MGFRQEDQQTKKPLPVPNYQIAYVILEITMKPSQLIHWALESLRIHRGWSHDVISFTC
jgi:hypothetical protein